MPSSSFSSLLLAILSLSSSASSQDIPLEGDGIQLWQCVQTSARQQWIVESDQPYPHAHLTLSQSYNASNHYWLVLDIAAWSNETAATVHAWFNSTGNSGYNEQWAFNGDGTIVSKMNGLCLTSIGAVAGLPVQMFPCSPGSAAQQFSYNAGTQQITQGGLCLDAGSAANCSIPPFSSYLYCDPDADTGLRIADLVSRLDAQDYPSLLNNGNIGVPRLGVPAIQFAECLHGPLSGCGAPYTDNATGYVSTGCPTSFPHLLLQASSFNRTLWTLTGAAVSDEDRGLHNQHVSGSLFWAPDVNQYRDSRWGRGQEVPGEDPTLTSEFAAHYVNALQFGSDERYQKITSTCKHFSGYDLEGNREGGITRNFFDANISYKDLVEYYWPAFASCVKRAKAGSIMCSYNAVNGIPSCANGFFQNEIVRGQWGWEGFFVSDCGAITDIIKTHNYTSDWNQTIRAAIHDGGTDVACDGGYQEYIYAAYLNGSISLSDLATAGTNFFKQIFAVGLMDPPSRVPYTSYGPERVDTAAHRQLALEAAIQGIVLLQNNVTQNASAPLLPLQRSALAGKVVSVIGPNGNATQTLLSNYHGTNTVVDSQSVLQSLTRVGAAAGFSVSFAQGCTDGSNASIACTSSAGFAAATAAAAASDLAVVVVGLCSDNCPSPSDNMVKESEGQDRINITLPGLQEALIQAVVATGVPTLVILIHGGPLSIAWTQQNVAAIVDAHYPGEMGGDAISAILFGDASPSGRLVTTTYYEDFVNERNITDMVLAPHVNAAGVAVPGITYLYYAAPVLFPFGWGLSYTTFSYAWFDGSTGAGAVVIDAEDWAAGFASPPQYAVNVTNTGTVTSDVSVVAFYSTGLPNEPIEELFDFGRIAALAPGATETLYFTMPSEVAATVSASGKQELTPGRYTVRIGDVRSTQNFVTGTLDITGNTPVTLFDLGKEASDQLH